MDRKPGLVASMAAIGVMLAVSGWAWTQLAPEALIPTHWASDGTPDRYVGKVQGLLQLPLVALAVVVLFSTIPWLRLSKLQPRGLAELSDEVYGIIWTGIWIASILAVAGNHVATILTVAGGAPAAALQTEIGLLLIVVGSYHLRQLSRTSVLGMRTPWTLASDLAWDRTQPLVGYLFIALGLMLVPLALLGDTFLLLLLFTAGCAALVAAAMAYSHGLWKIDPRRQAVPAWRPRLRGTPERPGSDGGPRRPE